MKGMLNMSQIDSIRIAYKNGNSITEIARDLEFDRKTVRKYLQEKDFTEAMPVKIPRPSKLDPYKAIIHEWLEEEQRIWHKQRYTAKRIYKRLKEETDYDGSYPTVQRYIKTLRNKSRESVAYLELRWYPGEAQADFGEADFLVDGRLERLYYLVLSFPHSNHAYVQVFRGETAECVCQGLLSMFYHMNGIPGTIIFDNASGIGRRIGNLVRESALFRRFRVHHGFEVRFCNPNSGHEKGNVENKVGFIRRNFFVPVRELNDLDLFNQGFLHECEFQQEERHYKKSKLVGDLFREDLAAMRDLPDYRFDVIRYETKRADGYGKICLDGKHYYSSRPELGRQEILVGIRAHSVELFDSNGELVLRQFYEQVKRTVNKRFSYRSC
jgi:transposase